MANIVITSTAYTVKVQFNDYSDRTKIKVASFRRNEISEVVEKDDEDLVTVMMLDDNSFDLSFNGSQYAMTVATVDGVAPTDNDHLFDLLEALQQV